MGKEQDVGTFFVLHLTGSLDLMHWWGCSSAFARRGMSWKTSIKRWTGPQGNHRFGVGAGNSGNHPILLMRSEILIPFSYLHFFWFYLHLGFNQSLAFHDVADIAASVTSSFLEVLAEWQKEVHSVETWLQKEHAIFETIFVILAVPPFYGWLPFFFEHAFPSSLRSRRSQVGASSFPSWILNSAWIMILVWWGLVTMT